MRFVRSELPEVVIVEPDVFRDDRGFFLETYHEGKYREGGIPGPFVQDNHSRSTRGILRGMHAQERHPQGKLVRVLQGEIFDVAVDIRRGSPRFRRWVGIALSADNFRQVYVPPGFAHGFCVLSEIAEVEYKCTDLYDPSDELRLLWNDPDIAIEWPIAEPLVSPKDAAGQRLADLMDRLPVYSERG
ncbi:MAG: dTDP-4-dehydrorhamnose 3,5-epimerase [Deltaproteobacteria bacterium]|nr:dTDP-4-dehydrorhamnose 3,5-epimerase [Deltaproteobacteria bacterium]MBI3389883.1 dTDP-4-dehydrorhamnose 3,5-epimerase [Deltaproteobacteria bacterium]